ncbi:MAG: amidohydrolase [Candidatus Nanopelagicales bacterium]
MDAVDILFVNGSVFTSGLSGSRPGGVAVSGGRIVALGPDDELAGLRGSRTEIVDLAGGLLLPGFQDAHVHPVMAGVTMLQCDVHGAASAEETVATIADYAAAHPDLPWIVGAGWSMEHFPGGTPTREQLDAVVPDRPAFLSNRDGHGAWANTRALELAHVTADTPDPADGRLERDALGEPTGTLHEGAAHLVEHLLPVVGPAMQLAGLKAAQAHLFSLGITAWQDAAVGTVFGQKDILPVYLAAAKSGDLVARVRGSLWWDRSRSSDQIADLVDRRGAGSVGRFSPSTVKIMLDGVAENFTAAMLEPYLDGCGCATENSGLDFVDPVGLREYVTRLDALGFQAHFHALGDRAVRHALDAVEAARAENGPSSGRHHLAHLQVVHPDDVPRFAQVGATANIQALWAAHEPQMDELTIPFLGERRAAWQYPFADIARAGGALAAGSDWSVSSADPLDGIHVAVNRTSPGAPVGTEPLDAGNALSLAAALTAYTAGSARVNHLDDTTGRLEAGYLADLCVLDRDPFARPATEIADATVTSTWVEGERVFGEPA